MYSFEYVLMPESNGKNELLVFVFFRNVSLILGALFFQQKLEIIESRYLNQLMMG